MRKYLLYILLGIFILPTIAYGVTVFQSSQVGTSATNGFVLQTNGTNSTWVSTTTLGITGIGTVTSIDGSGGTTGLTVTGGPITSSGTLTLGGTLSVGNGGTGVASFGANRVIFMNAGNTTLSSNANVVYRGTNIGIGSSTPFSTLSVSSTTQTIGTAPLLTVASTTNATLFTVLSSGNVGIGIFNPATKLHVQSSGSDNNDILSDIVAGGTGDPLFHLRVAGATDWSMGIDNSDLDKFMIQPSDTVGTTPAFIITTGGSVGIASTSPSFPLSVLGQAYVSATTTTVGLNVLGNSGGTTTAFIYSSTAGLGGRIILEDVTGTACTELTTSAGSLQAKVVTCPTQF